MNYPDEIKERVAKGMGCASQIREGWFDLVRKLDSDIANLYPEYTIDQIKEKFGTLRFYIGSIPDSASDEDYKIIRELISKAESKSGEICDVCGSDGKGSSRNGWYVTRCSKHATRES